MLINQMGPFQLLAVPTSNAVLVRAKVFNVYLLAHLTKSWSPKGWRGKENTLLSKYPVGFKLGTFGPQLNVLTTSPQVIWDNSISTHWIGNWRGQSVLPPLPPLVQLIQGRRGCQGGRGRQGGREGGMIKKVQYIDPTHITWKDHVLMCFGVSPSQIFMSSVQSAEIQDSLPISIQLSCLDPSGLKCR